MTKPKKTHRHVKQPTIGINQLADYMAASSQVRRTILRNCKYQPIARVIQHNEAKAVITNWLCEGTGNLDLLRDKVSEMRDRFYDEDFKATQNEHNCDYVQSFIDVYPDLDLPEAEFDQPDGSANIMLDGTTVKITPQMLISRVTKANTVKIGATFLRYSSSGPLSEITGQHQSAFIYGYLRDNPFEENAKPEHALCMTIDCSAGIAHTPPTDKAVYLYKEMKAECASIAERWDSIPEPPNAVL